MNNKEISWIGVIHTGYKVDEKAWRKGQIIYNYGYTSLRKITPNYEVICCIVSSQINSPLFKVILKVEDADEPLETYIAENPTTGMKKVGSLLLIVL